MKNLNIPRLDRNPDFHALLRKYCRLSEGEVWNDRESGHRVGCLDAANESDVLVLMDGRRASLGIQDPPYNLAAFDLRQIEDFIDWCRCWVKATDLALAKDSSLYVWLGADQRNGFQPLPDFMLMMRLTPFKSRSFITMRNQRGFGTSKNWMAVRQELLYYTKGKPGFNVEAEYTDIPKILKGYYKDVGQERTENFERSKSETIRAGNVWVDVQQVFYRMEENVNGCYAQKPLKSCERIIQASSQGGDLVIDFFAHSGSTLLSAEMLRRTCFTMDVDPVCCEISIRRLERFRRTGKLGWQNSNPFEQECLTDPDLQALIGVGSGRTTIQATLL